jgi:hypothetical protein
MSVIHKYYLLTDYLLWNDKFSVLFEYLEWVVMLISIILCRWRVGEKIIYARILGKRSHAHYDTSVQ